MHRILGSSTDIENTVNVAEHIQKVFKVLIDSFPDCALQMLEEVSFLIKKGHDLSRFLAVEVNRDCKQQAADLASYIEKTMPLFKKPVAEEEGEDPPETPPVCNIQDLVGDARLFASAGIGFGQ